MKRFLTALIVAVMLAGVVAIPAMAAPTDPEPCVAGVEIHEFTDSVTGNRIEVTTTTTCLDATTIDNITYEYRTVAVWKSSNRGGHLVPVEDLQPAGPWQRPCGPARAADVCR